MLPGYTADETIMTNIEILKTPTMPKSLIVVGSGAVGVEFASVFNSFGAEVTILGSPAADRECGGCRHQQGASAPLQEARHRRARLGQGGQNREERPRVRSSTSPSPTARARPSRPKRCSSPWAAHRAPTMVGLDKTNIQLDRGFVMTNEWMETTEPGIYAIGDIVGGLPQLAHVGSMCGLVVAAKMAGKYARPVVRTRIPGCTYTDPQIASVGLTEAQAKEKGLQVKIGKFPFVGNSKATILDAHDGFVKVVADAKYGEILGVHIIGPYATEIIAECVTAIELEATIEEMMFTIHAHPTVAEALLDGFSSVEGLRRQRLAVSLDL